MTNPTPHGQVPEALRLAEQYDHGDPAAHGNAWKAAVCTELRRLAELEAQIEALSGVQALSAAPAVPAGWKAVPVNPTPEMWKAAKTVPDPNPPYPPHYGLVWDAMLAATPTPPAEQQAAPKAAPGDALDEAMRERDDAEDFIDATLDEVLGHERPEWSSSYGRADALNDVQERMTSLHKPAVDKAWGQFQSAMAAPQQEAQEPVAYVHVPHFTVEGKVRPVVSFEKYQRGYADGIYSTRIPLYTAPQPAPAPLSEMPYEKRKAIQEGEQIGASDAWFKARHEMLDTLDRRNVFRAGFDRGWNAAIAAQGGKA